MIKTECREKDIDEYNFKFICVDESGEHVRHVFGKGSFDTEETFDTLVTCSRCTADADDLFVSARQRQSNNTANDTVAPKSTNALLREIVQEVKELKVEMANATQNVQRLNEAVFKPERAAPAATPTPSSLIHKGAARLKKQPVSKPPRSVQPALRAKAVTRVLAVKERTKSHTHKIRRRHEEDDAYNMEDQDASDDGQERDNDAQQDDDNAQESDNDVQESDDEVQQSDDDARADSVDDQDDDNVQNDGSQSEDGAEDDSFRQDDYQNSGGDRDDREGYADDSGRPADDDQ